MATRMVRVKAQLTTVRITVAAQGEQRTTGNAPAHAFLIAGAITLGHTDGKSGGKALCKADNQEGDAAVQPTAAKASTPMVRPTIKVSAML